jgi:hypothetical protein
MLSPQQRRKRYADEQNMKIRKMVEYKIIEPVPGEKGKYQYTGEFMDHCFKFKKETPYTQHEINYIEYHQVEIRQDYARNAITEYLQGWLNNDKLHDKFWNEGLYVMGQICDDVGSSRIMHEDEELEQERAR